VLSINGWTSGQIARAFGVTPDSVRRWRSWFAQAGVEGLRASERPARVAVKSEAAASVVASLLTLPVADRPNWTLPRLQAEIECQAEVSISKSQLSKTQKKWLATAPAPPLPRRYHRCHGMETRSHAAGKNYAFHSAHGRVSRSCQ